MQGLKAAAAVFCTACICAELVAQLTESGWARRGIKAVAGLYILAAAFHALPQIKAEGKAFSAPAASPVALGTWEEAAWNETQTQLERTLESRCLQELGVSVEITLTLCPASDGIVVDSVTAAADCTPEQQKTVDEIVEQTLGIRPEWNTPGGETLP